MSEAAPQPPPPQPTPARPPVTPAAPEPPPRTCAGTVAAVIGVVFSLLYVLNPTFGVFELLPDNLPGLGNLDEAGATALLIFGLRYLLRRGPRAP